MPRHGSCVATAKYLVSHIRETKALELALGLLWLAVLLTMKHFGKSRKCAAGDIWLLLGARAGCAACSRSAARSLRF